jgi:pimeloyl-ACP methyl ester carboxylesterase
LPNASESKFPWLNVVQYPFFTREFDTGEGWMSYADHGHGRPIVFVHGSLCWSFLFRNLMIDLGRTHRCIAPDLLGYGLSDKPQKVDYRPETQARRFSDLMDYLGLQDVTLVVQCAGGPIGLSWALQNPDRVRDVVLFNTWMWPLNDNSVAKKTARLVSHPINKIYYDLLPCNPMFILPALFADRHVIPKPSRIQYMEPFKSYRDRLAVYAMVDGLTRSRKWFTKLWAQREVLADKRALMLWGMKDPMFGEDALERFQSVFPNSEVHPFEDSGRMVPEESPRRAVEAMRWFLMTHSPVGIK